ncbi:Anaerobic sulfite reductase subunit A [subsurface metagenome]
MKYEVITKEDFPSFVNGLLSEIEVVGVKMKEGKFHYDKIKSYDELCLDYDVTLIPPKKYLLPPKETLLKFSLGGAIQVEPSIDATPRVILGVHPYDIKAIELMDAVFSDSNPDANYMERRRNTVIVGVDCRNPSPNAFCPSMGTDTTETGFDLLLTDIGEQYVVAIGSEKGEELLKKHARTREATEADLAQRKAAQEEALAKYKLSIKAAVEEIPELLEKNYDHPLWEELAAKCLSCGSCTMVCPTCVCFDVQDDLELNLTAGERFRQWDSCMLQGFAKVATGENFREDCTSRLRHRYFRKGNYMLKRYGKLGCVGCGRCIGACLAEIANPVEAYNRLKEGS